MYQIDSLEFNAVLARVSSYAQINNTKKQIFEIKPSNDIEWINGELLKTEEARKHIIGYGELPLGGIYDNFNALSKAKIGSVLSPEELSNISLLIMGIKNIKNYYGTLNSLKIEVNYLKDYLDFDDFKKLKDEIDFCIGDKANILDSASSELLEIRKSIAQAENRLRSKLQEIVSRNGKMLTDSVIVKRNDRFCVPVRVEYKNTFKGIIQDESSSGTTFFIEPEATVLINNQIMSLQNKEKLEIEKILRRLTGLVGDNYEDLMRNYRQIIELDLRYAKARYAINMNCFMPILNVDGIIDLRSARHPLIDQERIVPLDINLGEKFQTIIITGPNTGGKTVSLKTTGLLTIMAQAGLLIPALPESKIAVFDNVFVDIGDEQSIEQSLSTFSSHMTKIIDIINNLTFNSLVLLDELGGGTDPKEGTALAMAIVNYLRDRGARTIITTHYSELKAFAYNEPDIINASVEFDSETLVPTYKLLIGVPGKSNAFEIAKRLGLKASIINDAKSKSTLMNDSVANTLNKLELEAQYYNEKRTEYEKKLEAIQDKEKLISLNYDEINKEKKRILDEATKKASELYDEANLKIETMIEEIERLKKKQDIKEHEIAEIKHQTKALASSRILEPHIDQPINLNDNVYVIPYNTQGVVVKINKDKYDVRMGNLTATFKKTDLNFLSKPKAVKEKPKAHVSAVKREGKMELDLRGYRYEEAVLALDKFIDRALLANYHMVYIIHGFGTGAIRKAVWEYLKTCKHIESYRYGGEGEGLNGVTVAYLK